MIYQPPTYDNPGLLLLQLNSDRFNTFIDNFSIFLEYLIDIQGGLLIVGDLNVIVECSWCDSVRFISLLDDTRERPYA